MSCIAAVVSSVQHSMNGFVLDLFAKDLFVAECFGHNLSF